MSKFVGVLHDPEKINQRCREAREEFEENCIRKFGMVPFTEEYLNKCWPTDA